MKSNAPPSPGRAADWSAESEVSNAGLAGVESAASRAYRDGSASMRVICARAAGGPFITPASSADRSSAPLMASGFCWPAVPEPKAPGKSWPRFISWLWRQACLARAAGGRALRTAPELGEIHRLARRERRVRAADAGVRGALHLVPDAREHVVRDQVLVHVGVDAGDAGRDIGLERAQQRAFDREVPGDLARRRA